MIFRESFLQDLEVGRNNSILSDYRPIESALLVNKTFVWFFLFQEQINYFSDKVKRQKN